MQKSHQVADISMEMYSLMFSVIIFGRFILARVCEQEEGWKERESPRRLPAESWVQCRAEFQDPETWAKIKSQSPNPLSHPFSMMVEHLLHTRHYSSYLRYSSGQNTDLLSGGAYITAQERVNDKWLTINEYMSYIVWVKVNMNRGGLGQERTRKSKCWQGVAMGMQVVSSRV